MIAGIAKAYNLTPDYVLHEMSYANMILYGAVLPSYKGHSDSKEGGQEVIRMDDPKNRERARKIMEQFK